MQSMCFAYAPATARDDGGDRGDGGERSFFATALDGVDTGVALLDADARVVHSNRVMTEFVRAGIILLRGGRLAFADVSCAAAFDAATRAAIYGDPDEATITTLVARDVRGGRLIVTVQAASDIDERGVRRRGAVVVANDPARGVRPDRRLFQTALGLTPAEAVVAAALLDGLDAARVAQRIGISRETVRTHIKRIFEKTQTRRQPELVMLLARVSANTVMARTFTHAGDDAPRVAALA